MEEFAKKQCVAAMDLGTNSNRLLVADMNGKVLYRDVQHVALGDGLAENGCFNRQAIERALCSFMNFADIIDAYGVKKYRAIATAACRMSSNTKEFIEEIKKSSGIDLEVISEYEEARLTLHGARLNAPSDKKYLLVYDLGGGSTEVTLATNENNPQILTTISIPLGARNATEIFNLKDYNEEGAKKLEAEVKKYMNEFFDKIKDIDFAGNVALIATSSTPLRLASWCFNHPKYDKFAADGLVMPISRLDELIGDALFMPYKKRVESVYIGKTRAPIFVAACVIFKTIYQELGVPEMIASLKSAQEAIVDELKDE